MSNYLLVGFVCMRKASLAKYSKKIITEIIAIKPCVLYVGSWIVLKKIMISGKVKNPITPNK